MLSDLNQEINFDSPELFMFRHFEPRHTDPLTFVGGEIAFLACDDAEARSAERVFNDMLFLIDPYGLLQNYTPRVVSCPPDVIDHFGCNLICAVDNLAAEPSLIGAEVDVTDLGWTLPALISEAETAMRLTGEQALALFALAAPVELHAIMEKCSDHGDSTTDQRPGCPPIGPDSENRILESSIEECPDDFLMSDSEADGQTDTEIVFGSNVAFAGDESDCLQSRSVGETGYSKSKPEKFKKINERLISQVYDNLPERYSELYAKNNPEAAMVLRSSLEMLDPQNKLIPLLLETAKTDRNLLQKLHRAKQQIASKYGLVIKKWSAAQQHDFKDQYRFCTYLVDKNGNSHPVKFRNMPAYCLFVMYALDRHVRRDDATGLHIKDNIEEFRRLYRTLVNEDNERIDNICSIMERRQGKNGRSRNGRFDEYIKDIHDTFDKLVGSPDSMVLKVGESQYLQIRPEKIEVDRNLPKFNFL